MKHHLKKIINSYCICYDRRITIDSQNQYSCFTRFINGTRWGAVANCKFYSGNNKNIPKTVGRPNKPWVQIWIEKDIKFGDEFIIAYGNEFWIKEDTRNKKRKKEEEKKQEERKRYKKPIIELPKPNTRNRNKNK